MHIVTFDDEGKIAQIRQQWDQGSLLKQLEIIGKSGRNWPIKDGKEQLRLIQTCIKSTFTPAHAQNSNSTPKPRSNASTNAMRDPHASLHLFGSREEVENAESANVVSPYSGQRPKQRAFTDILTDEPQHWDDDAKRRSLPPAKIGVGKSAQPIRIFDGQQHNSDDDDDDDDEQKGPRYIRAHPAKYQHFAMNDGSTEEGEEDSNAVSSAAPAAPRATSKHGSTWSFEDFVTPVKAKAGRAQGSNPDARRFDTGDERAAEPIKPMVGKTRRDAEAHFEMQDDGELPPGEQRIATTSRGAIRNEGLYNNNLFEREAEEAPAGRALGNITNAKDRGKHFDPHFAMSDESPMPAAPRQPVTESLQKVIKTMNTSWSLADESPAPQKENRAQPGKDPKIHIAGDGMGGKQGTRRDFIFGGDDAAEPPKQMIGRKGNHGTQKSAFWDL